MTSLKETIVCEYCCYTNYSCIYSYSYRVTENVNKLQYILKRRELCIVNILYLKVSCFIRVSDVQNQFNHHSSLYLTGVTKYHTYFTNIWISQIYEFWILNVPFNYRNYQNAASVVNTLTNFADLCVCLVFCSFCNICNSPPVSLDFPIVFQGNVKTKYGRSLVKSVDIQYLQFAKLQLNINLHLACNDLKTILKGK